MPKPDEFETKPDDSLTLTAIELVDAAYDLVCAYVPSSPAQIQWKERWLRNAKALGAGPDY